MTNERTLGQLLHRCHQVNIAIWTRTFGPTLTAPQYAVLSVVAESESHDMQTVATIAALDKATMTGVVRRLGAGGWIRRTRHPDDGRRQTLALTPSATLALSQTRDLVTAAHEELLAPVPTEDRARLTPCLRRLARADEVPPHLTIGVQAAWARVGNSPGHLIRRAQQVHTSQWSAEFGQELTGPQFAVLRTLRAVGECRQTRLVELIALDKATLSGVIDRLARRGLVASRPDPGDRRSRLVALTDAGRTLNEAALPRAERVQAQTAEPVPPAERAWLNHALELLAFRGEAS
ncbi:MarR family transcriptional regulator [Nocardioides sp. cx-169]|uniref:MarR family winged helix-turn-helix transcriptional regulator n=1 Tax=Nocardioides sp. cx-169 TaxID=2899080 RepID=UPI001E2E247E|nr:MarR family transcriptional regulator [Nocardioides sp. cx-169]MCD4534255.1 MarR family transcriptional regulator [Nocardioides sp. cx-169]